MIRRFASILLIAIAFISFCAASSYAQDDHGPAKKEHVVKKMHRKKHRVMRKVHKKKVEKEDVRVKVNH
jgi:hypothetical protein